jgi:Flp pilus assembly protein TadD
MRKTILILSLGTLVLLFGFAGYRGYQVWQQKHWMSLTRQFAGKADVRNELLSLQQVLRSNPQNVEACRLMANLTEAARSPGALIWRQRVLELDPDSLDDRLALVQTAMIFKDYAAATNALEGASETQKNTVAYHNLAGVIALTEGQPDLAEAHFIEAANLDPGNTAITLNLAVVRLHGTNSPEMAEARTVLKTISETSTNFSLRCQAERELVIDAVRFNDMHTALILSKDLVQQTNSNFSDRLLRLAVLKQAKNAEFDSTLDLYRRESMNDAAKLYDLTLWQMAKLSPSEALDWLHTLPVQVQTNQPAALLCAECQTVLQDWNGLQKSLQNQNWGELEFIRYAFMTHALRGENLNEAAKAEWEVALKEASGQKATMVGLLRLAAQWDWQPEGEEILWLIVNRYPEEQWATQLLNQSLYSDGETRLLMQLYKLQSTRFSSNLSYKNNLAMTALLLGAQEYKPYELARDVYEKAPDNSNFISTYAFSLYLQGKNADALKLIQQLKPEELKDPSIAGYYGVILKATGNSAKARTYLDIALKGQSLPEERLLFEKVKNGA